MNALAKPPVHDDFGEKIGGAKKDLWKREGLHSADVDGLNSREADKYVKKDYIWKKPDYEALIASGVPVDVAYFRKTVRDSLSTAPAYRRADDTPEKRLARQKQYIDTVRQVQTVVEKVETRADVMAVFDKCMMEPGYFTWDNRGISRSSPTATAAVYENPAITNKLISTVFIRSETAYDYNVVRAAGKAGFGIPADEKPPRGYDVRHNDGKNIWSKDDDWKPGT